MRRLKGLILLCLLWACFIMHSGAQNTLAPSYIDSIQKIIDTAEHDSTLVNAYVDWGMSEMSKETDCILLFNKADSICLQNLKMVEPKLDGEERIYFEHKRIKIAVASGLYYRRQNLFEEAIAYLLKAEKIYKDKDDLGLAEVLKDLGALHYFLGRFQEAKKYTSGGLDVYSKNNNKKGMVACYGNLGNINTDEGDIDSGLEFYEKGLALAEEINYAAAIAQILGNIGVIYSNQGEYAKAIAIYEKGIKILKGKNEPQRIIRILGNLGVVHSTQGNYSKSIQAYMESLRMSEELGDKDFISWNLNSISWIYFEQKEYDKALEYAQKSLDILLETNLKNETAHAYYSLGSIYAEKGENNQALEFYNKSLNIAEEVNDQLLIANVLSNLGMHYYENEKDYSKAENYIIKSIEIYTQVNDQNKLFHNKSILADIYLGQGNIKKSISYQKEVLAEGEKMEVINLIKDASEGLYVAYKKNGNPALALNMYEKYIEAKDSIEREENQKEVIRQEFKYNYDKQALADSIEYAQATRLQEAELAAEKATVRQQKQQSYFLLGGLALAMLMGGFIYNRYRLTQRQKAIIEEQKKQVDESNLQLQQVNATKDKFFGIIAHDIRSPIVALDGVGDMMDFYVEKDDKSKLKQLAGRVEGTAKQLGGLLDNLLNWALLQQGVIPYHPTSLSVKEAANNTLEMFRNNADAKGVHLMSDVNANLRVNADESALNTILRNLVSNAIKFTPSGGTVSIDAEEIEDKMFIHIKDTGTGIAENKLKTLFSLEKKSEKGTDGEKGTGLGLTLVKELVDLNKGGIDAESIMNKGSQFTISLPASLNSIK